VSNYPVVGDFCLKEYDYQMIYSNQEFDKKIFIICFIIVLTSRPLKINLLIKRKKSAYQKDKPKAFQNRISD